MESAAIGIRYDRLGYVALNVTDPARSAAFYETIVGLQPAGTGPDGATLLRCSSHHHDIALYKAPEPGLKRLGWQLESEKSLATAKAHLQTLGLHIEPVSAAETSALGIGDAFRFREPNSGTIFEFFLNMVEAATPFTPTHANIARLGHAVLHVADRAKMEAFMQEELNFRVSDRIQETVTFMRCFPNRLHHSFGVAKGTESRLNHVNFMVTEIDDIGKALNRLKKNNIKIVFGPGRHPPSESVFLYFLDPDGMTVEYSFGMEEFGESDARSARELPAVLESIDYWGGMPTPEFGAIGKVETTELP
jgi:2,3-dihydroxy-p-cumate/2,3-dihydroxybenzoate 3,4-dioxygenase